MTDIDRIVRMLRVSESDPVQQEAADALEAQAKTIAEKDARIAELEVPLCIGRRTIGIMSEEGAWQSENGRAVVAADELFRQDPYARIAELDAALVDVTARLVAAVSLLERGGKKAAPSNRMFNQIIVDYKNCIERSRAALKGEK